MSSSAGIIIIGDEILSGRTKDTNINWIANELNEIGIKLKEARVIEDDKKTIINSIESQKDRLIEISDNIWEAAEPALLEFKSSKYLSDYAEENGFRVTRGVAEIPTAFVAEFGSGKPVIGILGEFDANPGISQKNNQLKSLWLRELLVMGVVTIYMVQEV